MQLYATLCNFMQLYATLCNSMQLYANLCKFMQTYATSCKLVQPHANLWNTFLSVVHYCAKKLPRPHFLAAVTSTGQVPPRSHQHSIDTVRNSAQSNSILAR